MFKTIVFMRNADNFQKYAIATSSSSREESMKLAAKEAFQKVGDNPVWGNRTTTTLGTVTYSPATGVVYVNGIPCGMVWEEK